MIFEYISKMLGLLKLCIYKIIYPTRISFKGIPQVNKSIRILTKKGAKITLGRGFKCREGVSIRADENARIMIGDNVFLNDRVSINCRKKISIGNNTIVGPGTMFFDHDHDYKNNIDDFITKEIIVGDNCWIGANVTQLKGTKIGNNSVIGAGTLINSLIDNNMLVYQQRSIIEKVFKNGKK